MGSNPGRERFSHVRHTTGPGFGSGTAVVDARPQQLQPPLSRLAWSVMPDVAANERSDGQQPGATAAAPAALAEAAGVVADTLATPVAPSAVTGPPPPEAEKPH